MIFLFDLSSVQLLKKERRPLNIENVGTEFRRGKYLPNRPKEDLKALNLKAFPKRK